MKTNIGHDSGLMVFKGMLESGTSKTLSQLSRTTRPCFRIEQRIVEYGVESNKDIARKQKRRQSFLLQHSCCERPIESRK